MNFEDSIRNSMKTKEQIAKEQRMAASEKIKGAVILTLSNIRKNLTQKAQNGEYRSMGEKKIIECSSWVMGLEKAGQSYVSQRRYDEGAFWAKKSKTELSIRSDLAAETSLFLKLLKEAAAADHISVEGFWAAYSVTIPELAKKLPEREVPLPSSINGYWMKYDFHLVVKSRMEISL